MKTFKIFLSNVMLYGRKMWTVKKIERERKTEAFVMWLLQNDFEKKVNLEMNKL